MTMSAVDEHEIPPPPPTDPHGATSPSIHDYASLASRVDTLETGQAATVKRVDALEVAIPRFETKLDTLIDVLGRIETLLKAAGSSLIANPFLRTFVHGLLIALAIALAAWVKQQTGITVEVPK